jgi:nitrite reductase/ring-hydroxylating ferredoxin subunit
MAKQIDSWETIAKASELPSRSMKHIEIKGKEIAIINLDGKYYAINDRCAQTWHPVLAVFFPFATLVIDSPLKDTRPCLLAQQQLILL